jgi:hypothetical protein
MSEVENLVLCLDDAIKTARRRAFDAGFSAGASAERTEDPRKIHSQAWAQFLHDENNRPHFTKFAGAK